MQTPQRVTSKRLRIFSTIIAALNYCVRNPGRLFVLVWFPCALSSACLIGLEWLVYSFPPRLPQWLMCNHFHPHTWLTPIVIAPFAAMAWALVLSDICDRNADRGIVSLSGVRIDGIRFELSPAVLLAAGIFLVTDFLDGFLHWAQLRLFIIVYPLFEGGDVMAETWAWSAIVLRLLAVNVVAAWTYPIVAQVLRAGSLDSAGAQQLMRSNRLRLGVLFFVLTVALYQLRVLIQPATNWTLRALVDKELVWTPREAAIAYLIDFPFDVLWTAVWAVTIAIVMNALASPAPSVGPAGRVTAAA